MGALRGCGRQKICVLIIFCSYYLLGQPIGISLAFAARMEIQGLWIGLLISLAICVPVAFIYTNFIQDWKVQAKNCRERIAKAALEGEKDLPIDYNDGNTMYLSNDTEVLLTSHRRSFSKSFMIKSSDNVMVTRVIEVDDKTYRNDIIKHSITYLIALLILAAAVMAHVFIPESSYIKNVTSEKP